MFYSDTVRAQFIDRPNRFIAHCGLDGRVVTVHVKNTGRCRELLVPGASVVLQYSHKPGRKTMWDLIAVFKGKTLINMDSGAPNLLAAEWLRGGGMGKIPELIRPEYTHGDSRFDFYFESEGEKHLCEVKGVTLEEDGVALFPDAPTLRGVRHLRGLAAAAAEGYRCHVLFVVQLRPVKYLRPNERTHPEFAAALRQAARAGVEVTAIDCIVRENEVIPGRRVEVRY